MDPQPKGIHHRIVHHVKKHMQKHHKKYAFGLGFLGGASIFKFGATILVFFGIGQMGGAYIGADYYDLEYKSYKMAALSKVFGYDFNSPLEKLGNVYKDTSGKDTQSIWNDEFSHNHKGFMGKIYDVYGTKLIAEGHQVNEPGVALGNEGDDDDDDLVAPIAEENDGDEDDVVVENDGDEDDVVVQQNDGDEDDLVVQYNIDEGDKALIHKYTPTPEEVKAARELLIH